METLTSKEKAALRNAAQLLKPAVIVGKQGVTPAVLAEFDRALKKDELVKVAFNADRVTLAAWADELERASGSACVGGVGKRRSYFRPRS